MKYLISLALVLASLLSLSGTPRSVEETVEETPKTVEETVVSVEETVVQETKVVARDTVEIPEIELFEIVEQDQVVELIEKTYVIDIEDQIALAQTAYGEYFLTDTPQHKMYCAAVMWCCCWHSFFGTSKGFSSRIKDACATPYHFLGYNPSNPITEELMEMAEDVLIRYYRYCDGESLEEVGCVLPPQYIFFSGNGTINVFRDQYEGGTRWDWSLPNPYEV